MREWLGRLSCALGISMLLFSAPAFGAGLDLGSATDKTVDEYDKPNPHFELDCDECHEGKPDFKKDNACDGEVRQRRGGERQALLQVPRRLGQHPPDQRRPRQGRRRRSRCPRTSRSRPAGRTQGQVVCSTCHFIHSKTAGLKLLRGFPESSRPRTIAKTPASRTGASSARPATARSSRRRARTRGSRGRPEELLLLPRHGAQGGREGRSSPRA